MEPICSMQTKKQADRYDEATSRVSQLYEIA